MAEKDANYYYNRAMEARQHGNERLAAMMENYARQLDADYGKGANGRDGYGPAEVAPRPQEPSREKLYQQYVASQQAPAEYAREQAQAPAPAPVEYDPDVANDYATSAPVAQQPYVPAASYGDTPDGAGRYGFAKWINDPQRPSIAQLVGSNGGGGGQQPKQTQAPQEDYWASSIANQDDDDYDSADGYGMTGLARWASDPNRKSLAQMAREADQRR